MIAPWNILRLFSLIAAILGISFLALILSRAHVPYQDQGTYSWTTQDGTTTTVAHMDAPLVHTLLSTFAFVTSGAAWLLSLRGRPTKHAEATGDIKM
ncbi:hypothetical protein [Luteolibacter soli]|uniref:Uncharacterized protein n=1 Tax=Luteolibacter soli TaxID=3135280 RepID=A0ABU9AUV1_9BACT